MRAAGALGAAHALIGLVVVVLGAITIGVATRKRWQTAVVTAVVTVCGILAAVAAVRMFRPVSMQVLAICVLVGLLVLIRMTPTVALWVARVRPPHFGSITGRDLFARRAGMPVDTVAPVSEADADDEDNELTDITARGTAIAASARLVNAVQVGMCVGVSLVLPAAVWGVLTPRQPWAWLALLVAGLTVGLFITQGRGFAAKYQAVALVCGASAAVCAGVLKYALDTPKGVQTGLLWPAIFVAAFAALGLAVALVVPATRFRPIIRLTVEWLEVLAMIALLPAAAALGGAVCMASPLNRPGLRAAAASAALTLVALSANVPAAQAIPPPSVDPAMVPADARPGPDQPMRRSNSCSTPITVRNPDVAQLAPGFNLVNISKAWQYSTGNGVPVAVIDTGVSPNPRLPVVPGGDYIMGEDGLSDCDAHGTVVSSIIAAAPLGILPMPRAMPATAAFPPPAGPPAGRSNSRLPTTLNARDQPPAEVSDQRVSGLTGAVQERGSLVDHHAKGAQCEQRLGDRLATQPGHAADRGWNTTTPHREVLVEYLAEPIDYLPAEPRAPPRLLRPPCAGLPRPMPESLVVAERHPIHRASVCLLVSGDHPATPKTRRRPSLPRRPLLFEL